MKLLKDANKLLDTAPVSVMEKSQVPPSGDKHDYMSLAAYWWPDSTKPGGVPYLRRDGERNPEINAVPDHGNLERLASTVHTLALAYFLTGKDTYAEHAVRFIRTWFLDPSTRMNPNLSFAQAVRGANTGRSAGVLDARRFAQIVDGVGMLSGYIGWAAEDQQNLIQWFDKYLDWLLTSTNGKGEAKAGNNHGVWYDVQASSIALLVGKRELARQIIEKAKTERIGKQIEPEGMQPRELARTTSQHYTRFNLEAFFGLASIAANVGVDLWSYRTDDGKSIRNALDWVLPFVRGDKEWAYKQIKKFDNAEYYPLLLQASVQYHDPSYADLAWKLKGIQGASHRIHLFVGK
jgi:hypothetical protein